MVPDWVVKILMGEGLAGAIIFVLLLTIGGLVAYIKSLHTKADKVYGYRLQERDTLNTTLTNTAKVLEQMLKVTEDRNDLTEQQARLIDKQAQAFEILKVTISAQYDNIRDHNSAAHAAVTAMAEAIRTLTSIVVENRTIAHGHVQNVQGSLNDMKTEFVKAVRDSSQAQINEMRALLGNVTRIEHRRKKTP